MIHRGDMLAIKFNAMLAISRTDAELLILGLVPVLSVRSALCVVCLGAYMLKVLRKTCSKINWGDNLGRKH